MFKKKNEELKSIREVCLSHLGVSSEEEINDWARKAYKWKGEYRIDKLKEMAAIFNKLKKSSKILIVGDFDADGITSTSILLITLKYCGFKNVSYRIPKRFSEGYGINNTIVEEAKDAKTDVLIVVDNGIAALEPIQNAMNAKIRTFILDHHLASIDENGKTLYPNAEILIDPEAISGSADFDGYCGAGLAYRFATELLSLRPEDPELKGLVQKLGILATIGTICDVMPLREENYITVKNGLKNMRYYSKCTVGLAALLSTNHIKDVVQANDIAFKIGPILNSPARLYDDGANKSIDLLTFEGSYIEATEKAEELNEINQLRIQMKDVALAVCKAKIEKEEVKCPIIQYLPNINEGITGLIAGKIAEDYKMPVIILTESQKDSSILKGSGRAPEEYDLKAHLDIVQKYIYKYGGHPGAAGLSVKKEEFDNFVEALRKSSEGYQVKNEEECIEYDIEIEEKDAENTLEMLDKFAPFGKDNELPIVLVNLNVQGPLKIMKNVHIKFDSKYLTALGFNMIQYYKDFESNNTITVVGALSRNIWNGKTTNQIEIKDFETKMP